MATLRRMAVLMAAGAAFVLILGKLPQMEWQANDWRARAVLAAHHYPLTLSDENLADAVSSLRLHHRLIRVGWDHSILSLDMMLRKEQDHPSLLAEDLMTLMRFSFSETGNVRQVLIRVYRSAGGNSKELLFYGDPRKETWNGIQRTERDGMQEAEKLRRLLESNRLSATPAGQRWLQFISNS